eukprot:gene15355-37052_t
MGTRSTDMQALFLPPGERIEATARRYAHTFGESVDRSNSIIIYSSNGSSMLTKRALIDAWEVVWKGREELMMKSLIAKYGPEPPRDPGESMVMTTVGVRGVPQRLRVLSRSLHGMGGSPVWVRNAAAVDDGQRHAAMRASPNGSKVGNERYSACPEEELRRDQTQSGAKEPHDFDYDFGFIASDTCRGVLPHACGGWKWFDWKEQKWHDDGAVRVSRDAADGAADAAVSLCRCNAVPAHAEQQLFRAGHADLAYGDRRGVLPSLAPALRQAVVRSGTTW